MADYMMSINWIGDRKCWCCSLFGRNSIKRPVNTKQCICVLYLLVQRSSCGCYMLLTVLQQKITYADSPYCYMGIGQFPINEVDGRMFFVLYASCRSQHNVPHESWENEICLFACHQTAPFSQYPPSNSIACNNLAIFNSILDNVLFVMQLSKPLIWCLVLLNPLNFDKAKWFNSSNAGRDWINFGWLTNLVFQRKCSQTRVCQRTGKLATHYWHHNVISRGNKKSVGILPKTSKPLWFLILYISARYFSPLPQILQYLSQFH